MLQTLTSNISLLVDQFQQTTTSKQRQLVRWKACSFLKLVPGGQHLCAFHIMPYGPSCRKKP